MIEAAESQSEAKRLAAKMKEREKELAVEAVGPNETARKADLAKKLKADPEYKSLAERHAVAEQAADLAETQAKAARYQLETLGYLTTLVSVELLVLDMQPAMAGQPQQAQVGA
jgi:hypothetical protein